MRKSGLASRCRPDDTSHSRWHRAGLLAGSFGVIGVLAMLLPLTAVATAPASIHAAPYHGGVLPGNTDTIYGCHAAAKTPTFWHFNLHTGVGGGAESSTAKACSQVPFRLGSQSQASAGGSEEVSVLVKIPNGVRNLTEHIVITYTATISETSGSPTGVCPSTPSHSVSAQYYNGTAWSYSPTITQPVVYNASTYYYYDEQNGASGGCSSLASLSGGFVAVAVAANGAAGFGLNGGQNGGASWNFGGSVATYAGINWDCNNYTLWDYGVWANNSGSCSNGNVSAYTTSYNDLTQTTGTNSTMTFTGSMSFTMWYLANFASYDSHWTVFLDPSASTSASTGGFAHGAASSTINVATGGNGIALKSITVT